jgi:hypothetical protein
VPATDRMETPIGGYHMDLQAVEVDVLVGSLAQIALHLLLDIAWTGDRTGAVCHRE